MDILELLQWFGGKSVLTLTLGPIWKRITGQQVIFLLSNMEGKGSQL